MFFFTIISIQVPTVRKRDDDYLHLIYFIHLIIINIITLICLTMVTHVSTVRDTKQLLLLYFLLFFTIHLIMDAPCSYIFFFGHPINSHKHKFHFETVFSVSVLCHVCITLFYISIVHNSPHQHPNILILINHLERSNIIKVFHDMMRFFFITVQLNIKNMNFYNEIT